MPRPPRRPLLVAATFLILATAARGQSPASLQDPRLAGIRRASAVWDVRQGPTRRVVDQVCLVPDVATYYEAIASWDDRTWFPVLIEDVELTLKFLRAFRPARVVRYPGRARPIEPGKEWDAAIGAVGAAWSPDDGSVPGNRPPATLGVMPPGVILARPESPSLPGLVALAAGRFQPLVRMDSAKGFG